MINFWKDSLRFIAVKWYIKRFKCSIFNFSKLNYRSYLINIIKDIEKLPYLKFKRYLSHCFSFYLNYSDINKEILCTTEKIHVQLYQCYVKNWNIPFSYKTAFYMYKINKFSLYVTIPMNWILYDLYIISVLICLRHFYIEFKSDFFQKDLFYFIRSQHGLSYHLI